MFRSVCVARPVRSEKACDNQCLFLRCQIWMVGDMVGLFSVCKMVGASVVGEEVGGDGVEDVVDG